MASEELLRTQIGNILGGFVEELQADRDAWELSSTNWKRACRVAQCERDALQAAVDRVRAVTVTHYDDDSDGSHCYGCDVPSGGVMQAADVLAALDGPA